MDFVKGALGGGGSSGGQGGELAGLGQLGQVFGHAEQSSGGNAGASDVMGAFNKFTGGNHKDTASAAKASGGDSGALDKLMGMHAAATGKSKVDLMDGFDASDAMGMCQIAEQHGISIPPSVMKKMVEYKLKGMI